MVNDIFDLRSCYLRQENSFRNRNIYLSVQDFGLLSRGNILNIGSWLEGFLKQFGREIVVRQLVQ